MKVPGQSKGMTETLDLEGKYFCLEHTGTAACPALVKERNARIARESLITNGTGKCPCWAATLLQLQTCNHLYWHIFPNYGIGKFFWSIMQFLYSLVVSSSKGKTEALTYSADKAGLPQPDLCSQVYSSSASFTIS